MESHVQRLALVWQMTTSVNPHKYLLNDAGGGDDDNDDEDGDCSEM